MRPNVNDNAIASSFCSTTLTIDCPNPDASGWGRVMVSSKLSLCEVGLVCPDTKCRYKWTQEQVKKCPVCGGEPDVTKPPYSCSNCDVFGLVRIQEAAHV